MEIGFASSMESPNLFAKCSTASSVSASTSRSVGMFMGSLSTERSVSNSNRVERELKVTY